MKFKLHIIIASIILYSLIPGCKSKNDNNKGVPVSNGVRSSVAVQNSAIFEAALTGQLEQVKEILKNRINANAKDQDSRTALMYASYNGHSEIIKILLEKGAAVDLRDGLGRTALMMASSGPYPEAVKLLLDNYANPNLIDITDHFTALMFAASEGQLNVVKILLAGGADPTLKDVDGDDAMTFATNNGHKEVTDLLKSLKK